MDVILKEDVLNLGFENDIVTVKNGYARNYLFPRRLAIPANDSNRKILAENLKQRVRKLEQLRVDAQTIADRLNEVTIQVKVKASEEGSVYGSVTNSMVADALKEQFRLDIDRKRINLVGGNIKDLGLHKVTVPLQKDITAEFTVEVVPE